MFDMNFKQKILAYPEWAVGGFFGVSGVLMVIFRHPLRQLIGIEPLPPYPLTYPVPKRQRTYPNGYE